MRATRTHLFQLQEIAMGLTFIGGFIDSYTFIQRGGVMAAGQTGNIIFLMGNIAQLKMGSALIKLMTIISFAIGIAITNIFQFKWDGKFHYWRILPMALEITVCLVVGFLPHTTSNMLVAPPLALVMAMQVASFTHIDGNTYNSTFTTGNLRNAVNGFVRGFINHDPAEFKKGRTYLKIVLSFTSGALGAAVAQIWLGVHTIWIAGTILFILAAYYGFVIWRRERILKQETHFNN